MPLFRRKNSCLAASSSPKTKFSKGPINGAKDVCSKRQVSKNK